MLQYNGIDTDRFSIITLNDISEGSLQPSTAQKWRPEKGEEQEGREERLRATEDANETRCD